MQCVLRVWPEVDAVVKYEGAAGIEGSHRVHRGLFQIVGAIFDPASNSCPSPFATPLAAFAFYLAQSPLLPPR